MFRIAVIHHGSSESPALAALRKGLHQRGLVEGDNCIVDSAGVHGRMAQLPALIEQLLRRRPALLAAIGGVAALAAQRATLRTPILYAIVLDPTEIGLGAPNVSGVTTFDPAQATRHLRLLRQLVPTLRRLAYLTDKDAPKGRDGLNPLESNLLRAAAMLGLEVFSAAVPGIDADPRETIRAMGRAHALVALEVPAVLSRLGAISRLAERHRIPVLSPYGWPVGGVVMQGAALHDAIDTLAEAVAEVMRGVSVANLPARTVHRERLAIHLDRAKRIELSIPSKVLAQVTDYLDGPPHHEVTHTRLLKSGGACTACSPSH